MKRGLPLIPLLLLLALLSSCSSAEDGEVMAVEDIALADITLYGSTFTLGQSDENPLYLTASVLAFYLDENRVHAEGMVFHQNDEEGALFIEGSAGEAEIDLGTRFCELSGGVSIKQLRDTMGISGEEMTFDSEEQQVESSGLVKVEFDGGTVAGRNLSADLKSSRLELSVIEEGVIEL